MSKKCYALHRLEVNAVDELKVVHALIISTLKLPSRHVPVFLKIHDQKSRPTVRILHHQLILEFHILLPELNDIFVCQKLAQFVSKLLYQEAKSSMLV